jgi:hypothetical protein
MRLAQGLAAGLGGVLLAGLASAAWPQGEDIGAGAPVIARGAPISQQDVNTEAGRPVALFHFVHIDAACGPTAAAIRLATEPSHGTLAIDDGEERPWSDGHPLFEPGDPRAHCGNRLVPTKDGVYTPARGFTGHDTLTIEFTEDGATFSDTIAISVW